jgi:hypothetical protein
LGVAILQETFDLTDEATVDQLAYNIKWQYALNITDEIVHAMDEFFGGQLRQTQISNIKPTFRYSHF